MTTLFIRLFLETTGKEASEAANRLKARLEPIAIGVCIKEVRPYWKINTYQEVCLEVQAEESQRDAFQSALQALGAGWALQGEGEAIWNPAESTSFVEPSVRWAHVEAMS